MRRWPGTEPAAVQGPQRAWGHQKAENQETGGSGQQHGQDRPRGRGGMRLRELEQECQIHVFVFALVLFWKKTL